MNYSKIKYVIKPKFPLLFIHKFMIGCLLLFSLFFFFHPQPYQFIVKNDVPSESVIPFLQSGDYVLEYYLDTTDISPESDITLTVYAKDTIDSENHAGILLAEKKIMPDASSDQISFTVEKDMRSVVISVNEENVFSGLKLQSVQLLCTDNYLMSFLCFFSALIIALFGIYIKPEKYAIPLLLIGIGLLACLPMANDFLIESGDILFHLPRIESIYQGLSAGEFPVRIGSAQRGGVGSLSATMYPQLFLYPFAALRFAKVSLMLCYKLLIAALNIGCSVLAYLAAKNMFHSKKAGIFMSLLYTFSLYRLVDVYVRAALGESLALTFLPLVLWGIYEILWNDKKKWYLLALGVTGVIQSHVLSLEMCLLFLVAEVVFWLFSKRHDRIFSRILAGVKAAVFSILLNASFLVPFLFFSRENLQCFHIYDAANELCDSTLYLNQIFFNFMHADGTDAPLGSLANEMPLSIGGILLIGMVLFLVAIIKEKREDSRERRIGTRCLIYGGLSLFLTFWIVPWDTLCRFRLISVLATSLQFPWRFLGIASILLCMVTVAGLRMAERRFLPGKLVYTVTILLLFISMSFFFESIARETIQSNDKMEINGANDTDSMYMYYDGKSFKPHHLDYTFQSADIRSLKGGVAYSQFVRKGSGLSVTVIPSEETEDVLLFPIYYYPGYQVWVNGVPVESYSYYRKLACDMPREKAEIRVRYTGIPIFRVGDAVTLLTVVISVFCMIFYTVKKWRKK